MKHEEIIAIVNSFFYSSWILRLSSGETEAQAGLQTHPSSQSREVAEGVAPGAIS